MAEEAYGKTVSQLKKERTMAKSAFTKAANFLTREMQSMMKSELQEEFKKLTCEARKLCESNDDYKAGLLAELEAEDEEAELEKQQEADLEKTVNDCHSRLDEVRELVQSKLWSRYGQDELETAIQEAEKACEDAAIMPVSAVNQDGYEVQITFMKQLAQEATKSLTSWEMWIPAKERPDLEKRVKDLRLMNNKLETKKSMFAIAQSVAKEEKGAEVAVAAASAATNIATTSATHIAPIVRIKPTSLPRFYGCKREFYRWKRDWESLQKQGEPTGSVEVKKIQLLDSVDEKVSRDLHLSKYNTAQDMFRVLENRFGNKSTIALEIIEELEGIPALKGNQPRKVIDLIQTVEKALADLTELGDTGALKNPLVTKSIECKLPDAVKKDWLVFMVNPRNNVTPDNHFDSLLKFLKTQEEILEKLEQLGVTEKPERQERKFERKFASTRSVKKGGGCVVCGDERHREKVFFCKRFKELKLAEKVNAIRKLGACKRCLGCHREEDECLSTYLCRNKDCRKDGSSSDHHFFLCPRGESRRGGEDKGGKDSGRTPRLTEEQEKFMAELSPEMAVKCRRAFTNITAITNCAMKDQLGLMEANGLEELPVIMMLLEVTANAGQKIGTLIDLASDTNYITHRAAERLKLRSEKITLVVHGVGEMAMKVNTRRYLLRVRVKTPRGTEQAHELICYGLHEIAKVHRVIKPEELRKFFPETRLEDLKRPESIELLISHREGRLAPQRVKVVGDLVLWDSPLGKAVGGAHPDLFEEVDMAAHQSETHFARSMRTAAVKYEEIVEAGERQAETTVAAREFLDWWKWDSIGAACEPKCGGCRCGSCQPGGKEMTLNEEREPEVIKQGLTYVKADAHSDAPHWDSKYPWIEDPTSLPNNRSGVEAKEVATNAKEGIDKLQRKAFSAVLTRVQAKRNQSIAPQTPDNNEPVIHPLTSDRTEEILIRRPPAGFAVKLLVDEGRFSSLTKLVRVLAWVWRAAMKWKRKGTAVSRSKWEVILPKEEAKTKAKQTVLSAVEYEDALRDLCLAAQEGVTFHDTTLNRLAVYKEKESGLLVCGGRIQIFNKDGTAVPILPYEAWISTLLAQEAHKVNHEEIAGTLLRMRTKAWVVRGRKLAKKVVDSCVICRKARARRCQQIMGGLPMERTQPARPFEFTTVDLFGPYEVKDAVRKRVKLKVWGIVFCCMASRAIHTDVVGDQSTEGFLLAYQRFTALREHPRKMWSDPGKNFVGAKPALKELYLFLDQLKEAELRNEAAKHGTDWSWKIHPADSPHRNGAAEAAVQIVKRALHNLGGDGIFTWGEFQTFLYMAANLANERPIDARTQSREDCIEYLSPNSLLLGRAGPKGDPGSFNFEGYSYKRLRVIQAEVNKFWKKWSQLAGPNLFIRSKWHTKERNVAVGDIVWVADQNALRSQYRLARVVSVNADRDGVVRDVNVRTFPSYPVSSVKPVKKVGNARTGRTAQIPSTVLQRDVRRIVVLLPVEEQNNTGDGEDGLMVGKAPTLKPKGQDPTLFFQQQD